MYNNVWDFFDEIYCINLDKRTDRWENVKKEFYSVGLDDKVQRFSAIEHEDGRIGVIKSNLTIIKTAKEKKLNNVLIFEDDVHFINNPVENLKKSIEQIGNLKWSLFYLGANTHEKLTKLRPNLILLNNAYAAHSLCYDNITYDRFISKYEILEKIEKFEDILDVFLSVDFQRKSTCLMVNPIITTQSASYSDIERKFVDYKFIEHRFEQNIK